MGVTDIRLLPVQRCRGRVVGSFGGLSGRGLGV